MSDYITLSKIPTKTEAENFLRKWGQQFYNSPKAGDTGIAMDVYNRKEDAVSGVSLGEANTGLWYAYHEMERGQLSGEFYSKKGAVVQLILTLRALRDGADWFDEKGLKEAHKAFCGTGSCFEEGTYERNLLIQAMHDFPGLNKAEFILDPEILEDVRKIQDFTQKSSDLSRGMGTALYENLAVVGRAIGLHISSFGTDKKGSLMLELGHKDYPDPLIAKAQREEAFSIGKLLRSLFSGSQSAKPENITIDAPSREKRAMALLAAIAANTDCKFGDVAIVGDKVKFKLSGTIGAIIIANPRELAEEAKLQLKNTALSIPKIQPEPDPLPPSPELAFVQAAFEPVGMQPVDVRFGRGSLFETQVSVCFAPPSENAGLGGMIPPDVDINNIRLALQGIQAITGRECKWEEATEHEDGDVSNVAGGAGSVTFEFAGDKKLLMATDLRTLRKEVLALRKESRRGGDEGLS